MERGHRVRIRSPYCIFQARDVLLSSNVVIDTAVEPGVDSPLAVALGVRQNQPSVVSYVKASVHLVLFALERHYPIPQLAQGRLES